MLVAAIQHDIEWEAPQRNFERLRPQIESAVAQGASLVVLSEMWSTGFSMNSADIAENPDGPTATFMHETAATTGAWITGSFPEHTDGYDLPTNRLLLAGPNGEDHRYSKIHPFTYAKEDEHYAAGRGTDHGRHRRRESDPVDLLRPAFHRLVLGQRRHHRLFHRAGQLAQGPPPALDDSAEGPCNREPGVCRGSQQGRIGWATRLLGRQRASSIPWGRSSKRSPEVKTTICAEVSSAVVAQARRDFPFMQDR